jgi:hypothetical protein
MGRHRRRGSVACCGCNNWKASLQQGHRVIDGTIHRRDSILVSEDLVGSGLCVWGGSSQAGRASPPLASFLALRCDVAHMRCPVGRPGCVGGGVCGDLPHGVATRCEFFRRSVCPDGGPEVGPDGPKSPPAVGFSDVQPQPGGRIDEFAARPACASTMGAAVPPCLCGARQRQGARGAACMTGRVRRGRLLLAADRARRLRVVRGRQRRSLRLASVWGFFVERLLATAGLP